MLHTKYFSYLKLTDEFEQIGRKGIHLQNQCKKNFLALFAEVTSPGEYFESHDLGDAFLLLFKELNVIGI